jgi:hypothetical protein
MRANKNKILSNSLQRLESDHQINVAASDSAAPVSWWRSVMQGLGSKRRRRALATMQRLAHHDVEDTISEADIQGWLSMLEAQSGKKSAGKNSAGAKKSGSHKSDTKGAAAAPRRSDRR